MLLIIAGKAALVAAAAHLISMLLARRSAAERHLVWVAAVLALLALPWLERTTPAMIVLDGAPVTVEHVQPVAPAGLVSDAVPTPIDWTARVWWLGMYAVLAWQVAGMILLRVRAKQPYSLPLLEELRASMGITRSVRLYTSSRARMPMTWGFMRPSIVLPEEAVNWTDERLRVVLLHELAHVARFDFVTQLAASISCALYWYNPLVWLGAASMRKEREKACDDVVLHHGAHACDYAEHLLAVASSGMTPAGAVPMAEASHLESRIRAALNPRVSRRATSSRARVATAALAALALLGVAVVKTNAQQGTNRVTGSVLDASGAAVPGAEVRAVLSNGSRRDIARSGEDGSYSFDGLPDGTYVLEARKPGFALLSKGGVALKAGQALQLNLTLDVGRISETLDVVGKGSPAPPITSTRAATPQRIRVGGSVQAAKLTFKANSEYPSYLQAQGVEGTVLLEGVVSTEGTILSLRSLNSLVHADLVKAATDAVQRWRYQPTLLNGKPVEVITTITVNYRLAQ